MNRAMTKILTHTWMIIWRAPSDRFNQIIIEYMKKGIRNILKYTGNILFILLMLFITVSCEDFFLSEAENVDIPGGEPQLVVNSYISPQDTLIRVYVHRSIPHIGYGRVSPVNENADVQMAPRGGGFTKLSYDFNLRAFTIPANEFAVVAGTYYQLKVESSEGEFVEAECYVPEHTVEDVSFVDLRVVNDNWGSMQMLIGWSVKPQKTSETNYLRTGGFIRSYRVDNYGNNPDTLFLGSFTLWIDRGNEFFSDSLGNRYNFRGEHHSYIDIDGNPGKNEDYQYIDSVFVSVFQTDYSYYRFHKSAENYFYYDDGFPFAESVRIYSNIVGGLGTFGGYNRKDYMIRAFPPGN